LGGKPKTHRECRVELLMQLLTQLKPKNELKICLRKKNEVCTGCDYGCMGYVKEFSGVVN